MKPILITYASKYGATKEIAKAIMDILTTKDLLVEMLPAKDVKDLKHYDGIILGSALYMGRWQKDAKKLIRNFDKELSTLPFWIFVSGPTGEGDPVELLQGKIMSNSLKNKLDMIKPLEIKVFHGSVNVEKLNKFEGWIMRKIKAETGDYRQWDEIEAWANEIGELIRTMKVEL